MQKVILKTQEKPNIVDTFVLIILRVLVVYSQPLILASVLILLCLVAIVVSTSILDVIIYIIFEIALIPFSVVFVAGLYVIVHLFNGYFSEEQTCLFTEEAIIVQTADREQSITYLSFKKVRKIGRYIFLHLVDQPMNVFGLYTAENHQLDQIFAFLKSKINKPQQS